MPFNREQQAAIDLRGKTILVSAPAGSGKTRILVSRMDSLILNDHYHINEFLVLTFTDAAASEMKQRLNAQLHEDLRNPALNDRQRDHLKSCIEALPHAYISTFDSFCKTLLAKYGYLIGVMPGFDVLAVTDLLENEVLDACLSEWIDEAPFKDYMKRHNIKNNFDDLCDTIKSFKGTTDSYVDFVAALDDFHERYYEFDDLNDAEILTYIKALYKESLEDSLTALNTLTRYAQDHNIEDYFEGTEKKPSTADALYNFLDDHLKAFSHAITFDTMQQMLSDKPAASTTIKWKDAGIPEEVKTTYTKIKQTVLEPFNKMKDSLAFSSDDDFKEILKMSYEDISYLLGRGGLLERFKEAYQAEKKKQGLLDFHDLEAYATRLLAPDLPVLTTLNQTFKEIMLDEYQDTNQIQENLVTLIAGEKNKDLKQIPMFMVGDMKQSIYRFRQADPSIFKHKFEAYTKLDEMTEKDTHIRIDLRYNYRSEKAVLDSINYIFDSIMDNEIGGLEYIDDPFALLRYDHAAKGKTLEELTELHDYDSELMIAMMNKNHEVKKPEAEAHMVAQRILKLRAEEGYDYQDICVLMRNASDFMTYKKIFEQYGIPANITLSKGLMKSNEALSMIALLTALIKPYDNVAMTSVLHNHFIFSDFDENELLSIRDFSKDNSPIYEDLQQHAGNEKVDRFLSVFEDLRQYAFNASPYDVLKRCYEKTGYVTFVSGLVNGEQRAANLDTLLELARTSSEEYPYLTDFVTFLNAGFERSPGKIFSDDNDAVEFMTIHKSKGLQFKVVFVSGMMHQFNIRDETNDILLDKDKGIAAKLRYYKDSDYGQVLCELDHPYRQMIRHYIHKEALNEEMRILYVALTRAEKKIIMTGVLDDERHIRQLAREVNANDYNEFAKDVVFSHKLRNVNNYLDWVLMALMRHPDVQKDLIDQIPDLSAALHLRTKRFARLNNHHTALARFHLQLYSADGILTSRTFVQDTHTALDYTPYQPYYEYVYPYEDSPRSIAVTTLEALEDEQHFGYLDDHSMSRTAALSLGTLVHNVLSYFRFDHGSPDTLIRTLQQDHMFTIEEYEQIRNYLSHLEAFIQSDIYQTICQSDTIYQEKMFRYKDEHGQIINGIFDLVFIKAGKISVLDYKTDHITKDTSLKKLTKKHQLQMNYYKKVLSQYYHSDVTGYIYYLETGQCITI